MQPNKHFTKQIGCKKVVPSYCYTSTPCCSSCRKTLWQSQADIVTEPPTNKGVKASYCYGTVGFFLQ